MAGSERRLTVVLAGDSRGMTKALGQAETATGRFGSKLGGLGKKAKVALAGAGVALLAFGKSSVDAFVEAEKSQVKLQDAYEKFPKLASGNIEALRELNKERAKTTRFDDDATAAAQATLAQYELTEDQIRRLTPLIQDYAARTGTDLTTAATNAGKAILGQGRAFKSVGLDLEDTGSAAGNLEQLMAGLNNKVGGFAEKEGKSASGRAEILKNQFGELQETVGSVLVPALLGLTTFLGDNVVPKLQTAADWLGKNKGAATALAGVVGGVLTAAMTAYAVSALTAAAGTIAATWPFWAALAAVTALGAGLYHLTNRDGEGFLQWVIRLGLAVYVTGQLVVGFFRGMWRWASRAFEAIGNLIRRIKSLMDVAARVKLPDFSPGFDVPGVPWFDSGGVMPGPRGKHSLAMVAGGETILPTHRTGSTGTPSASPNYYLVLPDGRVLAELVHEQDALQGRNRGLR